MDRVYLPVYDLTVGQLPAYQRLQKTAVERLSVQEGHAVLIVGVGNGNEVVHLLDRTRSKGVFMVGADLSRSGLMRCRRKVARRGRAIEVIVTDAQRLAFADAQFDRLLCLHTMDFLEDPLKATQEMMRALKKGGEFVISYPSGKGVGGVAKDVGRNVLRNLRRARLVDAGKETVAAAGAALAYAPLALSAKPRHGFYTGQSLAHLLASVGITQFTMEEDRTYQDFIVWGKR